jgi:hypothetical protein
MRVLRTANLKKRSRDSRLCAWSRRNNKLADVKRPREGGETLRHFESNEEAKDLSNASNGQTH